MTDSIVEKDVKRRSFMHKLVSLAAGLGIAGLLLGQDKTLVPPVHGADMVIDVVNIGTGTTQLNSTNSTGGTMAFSGVATAATGLTSGVFGKSLSTSGIGVEGHAVAGSGLTFGVQGESDSTSGTGVVGSGTAGSGSTTGVLGLVASTSGIGVEGHALAGSGLTTGVLGQSDSVSGIGVEGFASAGAGSTIGVKGESDSFSGGIGVLGFAGNAAAVPIVAKGTFGQLASLTEWQDNFSTALSVVDNMGRFGIETATPQMTLQVNGGLGVGVRTTTTSTIMTTADFAVLANASTGALTVTLPSASNKGMMIFIKKIDATTNVVTVSRTGTDTIEGAATKPLSSKNKSFTLFADGASTWYILSNAT